MTLHVIISRLLYPLRLLKYDSKACVENICQSMHSPPKLISLGLDNPNNGGLTPISQPETIEYA